MAGWLLVVSVVVLSIVIAAVVAVNDEREADRIQRAEANRVALALDAASSLSVAQLRATAAFLELHPDLSEFRFRRLVNSMVSDQPVAAVSYLESRPLSPRPALRAPLRDESREYQVRLAGMPGVAGLIVPRNEQDARHIVEVLDQVRESNAPAVTRSVRLRDDHDRHLVIFHPVGRAGGDLAAAASDEPDGVVGFTAGVIRVGDLLATATAAVPAGTRIALVDPSGQVLSREATPIEDYASTAVDIAGRSWELRLVVPQSSVSSLPLVLGLGGLALAAAIGLLLLNWSRRERSALDLARTRLEQRNRALQAEAETNRMYRLLAENLTDMVIVTDPEGRITYVSPAGRPMTGWAASEMVGRFVVEFLHPDDEADARLNLLEIVQDPGMLTFEHRLKRKDGSYVWVETAIRSVVDHDRGEVFEIQATTRDISVRKPMQDRLEQLAREDPLTGLSNRRGFSELLAAELSRSSRSGAKGTLLMIDIDRFKVINDTFGHLIGDRVLRRVAEVMKSRMRVSDTLARFGGDEFAAILPETYEAEGMTVAKAIIEGVREAFASEPELPNVTVSIGVAVFDGPADEAAPEEVMRRADIAMYSAKTAGRDRARYYRPDDRPTVERGTSLNSGQA